jgi:hypothetical protein
MELVSGMEEIMVFSKAAGILAIIFSMAMKGKISIRGIKTIQTKISTVDPAKEARTILEFSMQGVV